MNAEEMFRKSLSNIRHYQDSGLSNRVYNRLKGAYKVYTDEGATLSHIYISENGEVNVEKVKADILSGKIYEVHNLGISAVKELCEWIEKQETK
jgi:hypothetical protein